MQAYPVFFHDWHGVAIRQNGHWHLVPRHLSDYLDLDWKSQHRKITGSDLRDGVVMMPTMAVNNNVGIMPTLSPGKSVVIMTTLSAPEATEGEGLRHPPSAGGVQETMTLKLSQFVAWVLSINPGKVAPEKRDLLVRIKRDLLDAIERQLERMFGLPGLAEPEDFARLPLPPVVLSQMTVADCVQARERMIGDARPSPPYG